MELDAFAIMVIFVSSILVLLSFGFYIWFFKFGGKELAESKN
jgi:hypothetical protein